MGDSKVVEPSERHALFKADSGAMRFQVKATQSIQLVFMFHSKDNPRKRLFKITIAPVCTISNFITEIGITTTNIITDLNMHHDFIEFWVTWYNKKIQLGITGQEKPSLTHTYEHDETIGYIQFEILHANRHAVEWVIEESPVILKSLPSKIFDEDLTWCRMTDNRLPPNALIGGFEKEPIYVARVNCASSLVPGKYVPATEMAFIPWSGSEHATRAFSFEDLDKYILKVKRREKLVNEEQALPSH